MFIQPLSNTEEENNSPINKCMTEESKSKSLASLFAFVQPILNHSDQASGSNNHSLASDWVIVKDRRRVDLLQRLSHQTYG